MRSRLAAIPALLLVAVAVWEIVATRVQSASVPGDEAWDRAAQLVRAKHRPGDLIVFAPDWADPIGRLHLGDLIPLEMASRMDAARYGRIWELAIRDATAPDVVGLVAVEQHDIDGVILRRYERTPVTIVADVRDSVGTARVTNGGIRVDLFEVAFEPHRCVLAPTPHDRTVTITFPRLALGSELVGYVGIADVFTRKASREPIELTVSVAGTPATASARARAPIDRWVEFRLQTTPGTGDVTFTLDWTPAKLDPDKPPPPPKQVCFVAEART